MHLVRMNFGGVPPLTQPIAFRFDEQVNVFVGPNASGKSVLLKLLADNITGPKDDSQRLIPRGREYTGMQLILENDPYEIVDDDQPQYLPPNFVAASDDWPVYGPEMNREGTKPPVVYVGAVREELPAVSNQPDPDAFGDTAAAAFDGTFSGPRTMAASLLLGNELRNTNRDDLPEYARVTLIEAIRLADACSQQVCAEVIRDSRSHNYIHGADVRGWLSHPHADPNLIPILRLMGLNTTDIRNFNHLPGAEQPSYSAYWEDPDSVPIYLGHASSGTEGTLLWIRWLALKMVHHYGFAEDWSQRSAILLIDEIENHLHPTWQRRVIPALRKNFPGLQIFATTHSPFVVAGLEKGQVHLLQRDAKGVVTATTNERDVIGWTADEILQTLMGVDEPTDQLTIDRASRLRQLRGQETLTPEEESEMNELRRQVNANLLARGGDSDSDLEDYASLMRQVLLARQSDLAQEGD